MQWQLIDFIGFAGAILLLYAFWRNANGTWQAPSLAYAVSNVIAAIILSIYSMYKGAHANVALNIVWLIVACVSVRTYFKKTKHKTER